mmetsp:Transcript_5852/g.19247  ORF Transcript_5852/g.19247 Transcript_5852/m.19247 type:complete len:175 (+) Transcript_5852:105-629(+)
MEFCSPLRGVLPQTVLTNFPRRTLQSHLVYQPAGGGFLMRSAKRFKGECASIDAHQVSALETAWLDAVRVRHYNYTDVAIRHAPLMFDAIHFTYYWVKCEQTFPEMARLVAQLGLQHAMHKPLQLCPAPPPPSPIAALQERQRLPLRMTEWDGQPRSFYLPPEHKARSGGRGAK